MKSYYSTFKSLAKRHQLVLTRDVPVEESAINWDSLLSHSGSLDTYLAHGAVGHSEVSIALRQLVLKDKPKSKAKKISLFAIAVPQSNSGYMLIASTNSLPKAVVQLIEHTKGMEHKGLSDGRHHQIFMKHMPQPHEQAYARKLAAKLPESVNLEKTSSQLVLFTANAPDGNQAEHLLRLAIGLS